VDALAAGLIESPKCSALTEDDNDAGLAGLLPALETESPASCDVVVAAVCAGLSLRDRPGKGDVGWLPWGRSCRRRREPRETLEITAGFPSRGASVLLRHSVVKRPVACRIRPP